MQVNGRKLRELHGADDGRRPRQSIGHHIPLATDVADVRGVLRDPGEMPSLPRGSSISVGGQRVGEWLVVCEHDELAALQEVYKMAY